ncbi:MAG TPA: SusC/RagA family TonB-linked outer membrane protein [Dinghuibacter sp.]|uniref:SusC/RagA family TonB-linked outer membrane protein n=1 Tax=Dinghuibacter sp. TaxID=2024697 RepID=UPI002BF8955F|nr:SusC/RagA family TonB-linked outer membrane protein [Dinghuibacter sp.]HTJ11909.1 SusC/RagA family TonB-linked outer membrane protein [Dinghuibacter sp.]
MQLTSVYLLALCLQASAAGLAQKVSISLTDAPVSRVFTEISRQTGVSVIYNEGWLKGLKPVTVHVRDASVSEVLELCFKGQPFTYEIVNNNVLIKPAAPPGAPAPPAPHPLRDIHGRVLDDKGSPVAGASVLIKGTQVGVATNEKGEFSLSLGDSTVRLVISYVGMETTEARARDNMVVVLKSATQAAEDIIVVGYGKDTRQKITSAVSTITTDDFKNDPYTDIQSALQGRVSGVMINAAGGEPGSVPSMTIRGGEPLIGQTAPLYVIDGIIRDQTAFVALNMNDIDNISFLKDAAATAVYGAQASAGIVLVTTKQGKAGKMQLTYSNNMAWNTPSLFPKLLDSYQKALVSNAVSKALGNGNYSVYSAAVLDTIQHNLDPAEYPNTDWYHSTFRKYALQQRHDVDVTGGNAQTRYYIGLGYFNQGSNYVNNSEKLDRFSYRSNIVSSFDKIGLDVTLGLNGYFSYQTQPPTGAASIFSHIVAQSPLQPPYNKDGSFAGFVDDPLAEIYSPGYSRNEIFYNDGTLTFAWSVPWIKGLKLTAIGDYNLAYNPSKIFNVLATQYNADGTIYPTPAPTLTQEESNTRSYDVEFHADYSHSFGKHNLQATAASVTRAGSNSWFSAYRGNFPSTAIDLLSAGDASTQVNNGSATEWGNVGYVGRVKYDYDSRYIVELAGRYDGSDYFPPGKRFGLFPSVSLGWAVSKERFYVQSYLTHIFDFFKLRGSIGTTGSVGGTKYAYIPQYNVNTQVFVANGNLENGYSEGALTLDNQNITWYATRSYDWGFDFSTLKHHLTGEFNYFFTRTTNILGSPKFSYTDPLGQGLPQVLTNAATRKAGIDLNLTYKGDIGRSIKYYLGFNCTYFNYLWERSNEDSVTLTNPYTRAQGYTQSYYGAMYYAMGLYQNYQSILNNPVRISSTALTLGDVQYLDANGDGQINAQDYRNLGKSSTPLFQYGITFGISYKGISLDGLFQGTGVKDVYLGQYVQAQGGTQRYNFAFQLDYWNQYNTQSAFPRAGSSALNNGNNYVNSSYWLVNTQYFRLKSLSLGYDLRRIPAIRQSGVFKELSAFVSGTNLLTFSPCKKYFDPELADANNFFYPVNKTYSLGVRVGF